jgi:hypothetical protein
MKSLSKKQKIGIIIILCVSTIGISGYFTYNYLTTHYDIPEDYPVVLGTGIDYYIDSNTGNDANTGLTPNSPWKTVDKVNTFQFAAGDRILFSRNGVWRERIIPQGGTKSGWLYYGAYGVGCKPLFLGSVALNTLEGWTTSANNIWVWTTALSADAGNLIFNNESEVGVKKWTIDELSQQGDYYFQNSDNKVYMYSAINPALIYSDIECAVNQHMLYNPHSTYRYMGVHDIANIVFENLAFRYGGGYAFKFQTVHHIQVLNCDMAWMGGSEVDGQPNIRYGNGIEFFGLAFYCVAAGNSMTQIYDSGVSYQSINHPAAAIGINFSNNFMSLCGYAGLELWLHSSKGEITDFTFANNHLQEIGGGWGGQANQRKSGAYWGFGFLLDRTPSKTHNIQITGNWVNKSTGAMFVRSDMFDNFESVVVNNNQYLGNQSDLVYATFSNNNGVPEITTQYNLTEFKSYQTAVKKDLNSSVIIS